LTEAIKHHGIGELADQAGLSRRTVWAAKSGKTRPTLRTRRKLQQARRALKTDHGMDADSILSMVQHLIATGRITLRELARRIDSDPSNLYKILQGKRAPTAKMMEALRSVIEKLPSDQSERHI
jgi:transcriptional regulator with XRE-family HTH domain